jgi:hypothetical protein
MRENEGKEGEEKGRVGEGGQEGKGSEVRKGKKVTVNVGKGKIE